MLGAFLSLAIILLSATLSHAQDAPYGLSMHGTPKYNEGSTHLSYADPETPKGGHFKEAAIGTFDTLNPFSIQGKSAAGLNLFYDRLSVRVWDEPFSLYPLIASSLEMPEDRSSLTISVNPKARFHDDSHVTPEDILFSFNTLKNHGRPNMRAVYKLVENIETLPDGRIRFSFGEGFDRETGMVLAMMPVLSKAYWQGRDFDKTTLEIPIGNGPYKIKEVDPGRKISYIRDPDYWAADHFASVGHYNFDRITYDYFRDSNIAFEAFKAGELNFRRETDIAKWNSAYDFLDRDDSSITRSALPHGRPERARGFIFNMRRAPFDDIRVREALSLLFDFEWMNKNFFGDAYKRIESIYPNAELAAQDESYEAPINGTPRRIRANRMKAGDLLDQAGWVIENGKRMKDGQPLEFELLLGNPKEEKTALYFARALEREGITLRTRVMDSAAFRDRLNQYDFDMTSYFWLSSLSPGTEQLLYWSCAAARQSSQWNFAGICDPEIDTLAGSIANTKTREELITATQELDELIMNKHIMIPLYYSGQDYFAHDKSIQRPGTTPLYGAVLETWWMDDEQTRNQD